MGYKEDFNKYSGFDYDIDYMQVERNINLSAFDAVPERGGQTSAFHSQQRKQADIRSKTILEELAASSMAAQLDHIRAVTNGSSTWNDCLAGCYKDAIGGTQDHLDSMNEALAEHNHASLEQMRTDLDDGNIMTAEDGTQYYTSHDPELREILQEHGVEHTYIEGMQVNYGFGTITYPPMILVDAEIARDFIAAHDAEQAELEGHIQHLEEDLTELQSAQELLNRYGEVSLEELGPAAQTEYVQAQTLLVYTTQSDEELDNYLETLPASLRDVAENVIEKHDEHAELHDPNVPEADHDHDHDDEPEHAGHDEIQRDTFVPG